MNRREFVVGGLALTAGMRTGTARAESGPLTKIIFPFSAGGSGEQIRLTIGTAQGNALISAETKIK